MDWKSEIRLAMKCSIILYAVVLSTTRALVHKGSRPIISVMSDTGVVPAILPASVERVWAFIFCNILVVSNLVQS